MKRIPLVLFVTFYLGYLCLTTYIIHFASNRYYDLTFAIVDEGRLTIDTYQANTADKAFYQGHFYTAGLPGPALLGVPIYWAFKQLLPVSGINARSFDQVGESQLRFYMNMQGISNTVPLGYEPGYYFLSSLILNILLLEPIAALAVVLVYLIALHLGFDWRTAMFGAVMYGAASTAPFFATAYYSHAFAATFVLGAVYAALRWAEQRRRRDMLLTAVLLGCGFTMEYVVAVAILVLGVFLLFQRPRGTDILLACSAGCVSLLPLVGYNLAVYGTPFASPHQYVVVQSFQQIHSQGFLGMTWPRAETLWQLSFGPKRGIFGYAPILLLTPIGAWNALRHGSNRSRWIVLLSIFIGAYLYNASYIGWEGGATVGPRFMFIGIAAACLLALPALQIVPRWLVASLFTLSTLINLLPFQMSVPETYFDYVTFVRLLLFDPSYTPSLTIWSTRAALFLLLVVVVPLLYQRHLTRTGATQPQLRTLPS